MKTLIDMWERVQRGSLYEKIQIINQVMRKNNFASSQIMEKITLLVAKEMKIITGNYHQHLLIREVIKNTTNSNGNEGCGKLTGYSAHN